MARYTDFFLATDAALARVFAPWTQGGDARKASPDLSGLERVEMKTVDQRRLAQLLVAADGEPLASALEACSRPALALGGAHTPVEELAALALVRLPERLVDAVTERTPEQREHLAAAWETIIVRDLGMIENADAREFEVGRWSGAPSRILSSLAALLERRRPGESLYVLVTG